VSNCPMEEMSGEGVDNKQNEVQVNFICRNGCVS
jgi:hypothetical protein